MQCNKFYKITLTQDRNSESGGWKLGEGRGKLGAGSYWQTLILNICMKLIRQLKNE